MQEKINVAYRGFELIYRHDDMWVIGGDSGKDRRTFEKLSDAKIYINGILKESFKRFNILRKDIFGDKIEEVTVTSKIDDNYYWVKNKDDVREKVHRKYLYILSDKNKQIIEGLGIVSTRIEELKDQKENMIKNLEMFKDE